MLQQFLYGSLMHHFHLKNQT